VMITSDIIITIIAAPMAASALPPNRSSPE
jgi:hypothetical protein